MGVRKMSAHSTVLIEEISAAWLRNALGGVTGALVLLTLFILLP
jgi:hypothetical protein